MNKFSYFTLALLLFGFSCTDKSPKNIIKKYYANGNLRASYSFVGDTLLNGPGYEFYPSGKIKFLSTFKLGKRNGVEKAFWEDGTIDFITYYKEGVNDSFYRTYYPSNKIKTDMTIVRGKQYGKTTKYRENGILWYYKFYYPADSLMYSREYDEKGTFSGVWGGYMTLDAIEKTEFNIGDTFPYHVIVSSPPDVDRYVCMSIANTDDKIEWDTIYGEKTVLMKAFKKAGAYRFQAKVRWHEKSNGEVHSSVFLDTLLIVH